MPLLEEVSDAEDIDNLDMDLAEFDPSLSTPLAPKLEKTIVRSQDLEEEEEARKREKLFPTDDDFNDDAFTAASATKPLPDDVQETLRTLQILYPCYFDKNRSRQEGRRVSKELAVENPLAQTVQEACNALHLITMHEATKTHPQDWGNPGRIRVLIKEDGKPTSVLVDNKRHLMNQVAKYLKSHETTLEVSKKTVLVPELRKITPQEIPVPKGLKINKIVPLHSPLQLNTDPMFKSIYEPQPETAPVPQVPKVPKQKNKFMHVRR